MNGSIKSISERSGFTLVELLVVITIIGILIALLLPAVQAARESARRIQCSNQLKQLGIACLAHEEAHRHLPSNGWGWKWTGDASRGFGIRQPGGWIYNILPYVEQEALRALPSGNTDASDPVQRANAATVMKTALPGLICPTRRAARAYPFAKPSEETPLNASWNSIDQDVAKTDYAANSGGMDASTGKLTCDEQGPDSAEKATDAYVGECQTMTGVIFQRSTVTMAQIRDGLTSTYLIGEKALNTDMYVTGQNFGDNGSAFTGHDKDNARYATEIFLPTQDTDGAGDPSFLIYSFGSAHAAGWNVCLCDGSVRTFGYWLDPQIHQRLGNRDDGQAIDGGKL